MSTEPVFVVERRHLFGGDWPQGFLPVRAGEDRGLLESMAELGTFAERARAEEEPAWKQPIPYCVIRRGDRIFVVERTRRGSEERLHGLLSIGLGGHVEPGDGEPARAGGASLFRRALWRELHEELVMDGLEGLVPRFAGLLNDDGNPVGAVHAGLVFDLEIPTEKELEADEGIPRVREISKLRGGFRSLAALRDLWQDRPRFESWSRILMESRFFP